MAKGKKKGGNKATNSRVTRDISDNLNSTIYHATARMSEGHLEREALRLEQKRQMPRSPFELIQIMKDLVDTTQTVSVDEQNRLHSCDDGDQRPLPSDQQCQVFRNMWSDGFDMSVCLHLGLYPVFTMKCIVGDLAGVTRLLKEAVTEDERKKLLETRSTVFRASPLQLTIGHSKYPQVLEPIAQSHGLTTPDPEGVVRLLLKSGANPNVKDIAGKTLVHWGAGGISTPLTRKLTSWCIAAAKSSHCFGQRVTINGLTSDTYNGKEGILGGFDVDTGRRIVTIQLESGEDKELLLQPKNIFNQGQCIYRETYNLVDVPDRLGSVTLHEVIMQGNPETAKFLCHEHNANVDVPDVKGITPRFMSLRPMGGLEPEAMRIIKMHACKNAVSDKACSSCGKEGASAKCSRCGDAWYCNRECQTTHWAQHKKVCKKREGIKLDPEDAPPGATFITTNRKGVYGDGGYKKPSNVKIDELFWVKVQRPMGDGPGPLLLYEKRRECQFYISPSQAAYREVRNIVEAEKGSLGTKTHFQARFNAQGEMYILPHTAQLQSW